MAYEEKKLYKELTVKGNAKNEVAPGSRTYRGISTVNPNNTNVTLYDLALIKQDIINHFHIRQGEKLSDPEFGTIIWDALFEPLTENLKDAIISNVEKIIGYDPRVRAENVVVDQYESGLRIEATMTYLPYNISETMRFSFDENAGFLST